MKLKTLSKSEIKEINYVTQKLYGKEFLNKKDFVQIQQEPIKHIKVNKKPILFFYEDKPIPLLKILLQEQILKKIIVDMGAVRFLCNGADVMRPGVVEIDDDIEKGEIVAVIDEKNKTPLVVGKTMYDSKEMQQKNDGRIIKNLHYIGDALWNIE
jgi:PUA domain protein